MLWAVFAILSLVVVAILVAPLVRGGGEAPSRADYDIVVFRHQLAEIAGDVERGLITAEEADAARAEVHRRMLAAEDAELDMPFRPARSGERTARIGAIVAIAVLLPLGAGALYGGLGSPRLPGEPYDWRLANDPEFASAASARDLAPLVRANPSAAGYRRLGQMYFLSRDYGQAAVADRRAVELGADDVETWSELGESVVMLNGGGVMPEALAAFSRALALEPKSERSRFYIGLAEAQIGRQRQAVAIWRDLEKDSAPGAPWLAMLRENIVLFARQGGFDPGSVPPAPPSASSLVVANAAMAKAMQLAAPQSPPGALPENAEPPVAGDARDTMIRAMVQRLADRLEKSPADADGWVRLARAYLVLGDATKARLAIDHAVRLKPDDANVQATAADIDKAGTAGKSD